MKYPSLAILIPCYNEAECIQRAVQEASFYGQVIVIDNGSDDSSFILAQQAGAHVIKENRRGYGNAIMSGMLEARRMNLDIALVLDADLSDNPSDIPILVEPVLNEGIVLCLSSRTRLEDQQNLEPHQRFGNRLAVRLIQWKTGFRYRDMGPFRAFNINTLLNLHLEDENFGWNIEMQMKAALHGLTIREIELPYRKRIAGTSKVSGNIKNSIRAGIIILQSVWKYS
jgi:glycosyltransferase involved in cell wall biosynthesis